MFEKCLVEMLSYSLKDNCSSHFFIFQFATVEESVRRQVKTASVAGAVNTSFTKQMRGFILSPDLVDFGILKEGLSYSYKVNVKNVGVDPCRFKIKQPPPSTGLKAIYKPGPVSVIHKSYQ